MKPREEALRPANAGRVKFLLRRRRCSRRYMRSRCIWILSCKAYHCQKAHCSQFPDHKIQERESTLL